MKVWRDWKTLLETNQRVLEWVQKHAMVLNGERLLEGWGTGIEFQTDNQEDTEEVGKGHQRDMYREEGERVLETVCVLEILRRDCWGQHTFLADIAFLIFLPLLSAA